MIINPRMLGIMLIAASVLLVTTGLQNAKASPPANSQITDVDVEEAAEAGNSTMTASESNQTSNGFHPLTFLFVQSAQSGSVEPIPASDSDTFGTHKLTLSNLSQTIEFSERPDRIVSAVDNNQFVKDWYAGGQKTNSFASDPPNAALVVHGVNVGVVELLNPKYDNNTQTIQYDIQPLGDISLDIPSQFDEVTLVIDCGGGVLESSSCYRPPG